MNDPYRKRGLFGSSLRGFWVLCCFGVFGVLMFEQGNGEDGNSGASVVTANAILQKVQEQWQKVHCLQYELSTKDTESEAFKEMVHRTTPDRDVLVTHLSLTIIGADYGWKSDTYVPATGAHERDSIGGLTDGTLAILSQGNQSQLTMTKNPKWQSSVPVSGYNPLMEAFSFLVTDNWSDLNSPVVSLQTLASKQVWSDAAKRITSVQQVQFQSKPCLRIVFGNESGNHDVVYFETDSAFSLPLGWQHFEGAYLRREVAVKDIAEARLQGGGAILFPRSITNRQYYLPNSPSIYWTSEQSLDKVTVNGSASSEDLAIDPSLADSIYDRDSETTVMVPK